MGRNNSAGFLGGLSDEQRQRRLLELQQAVQGMGGADGVGNSFAPVSNPGDMGELKVPGQSMGPLDRRPSGVTQDAPIIDTQAFPLQDAPRAPRTKGMFGRRGVPNYLPGGYSPDEPLPQDVRNGTADMSQFGGPQDEPHRNLGQQILRAMPVVLSILTGHGDIAGKIIAGRQSAADQHAFGRVAFSQLVHNGVPPAQAAMMVQDPKSLLEAWNKGQEPHEVNQGNTYLRPGMPNFTAPKMVQHQASTMWQAPNWQTGQMDQSGQLLTADQQYAASLGQYPGSPGYQGAIQDAQLGGDGPTAFGYKNRLQGDRLAVQRRGQDITRQNNVDDNRVSTRGQDITRQGQRDTNERWQNSPIGTMTNDRGEVVQGFPGGGVRTYRDSKTTAEGGRSRGSGVSFGGRSGGGGARPRARNAQGQQIEWNGSAWVPVN